MAVGSSVLSVSHLAPGAQVPDYRTQLDAARKRRPRLILTCGPHAGHAATLVGRVSEAAVPAVAVYLPATGVTIVTVPSHLALLVPAERAG